MRINARDARFRVSVRNTGQGISDAFAPKVFEPFSQADSSDTRGAGGTGLGLHISKKIVENMGGDIGFTSPGQDLTEFWFTVHAAHDGVVEELENEQITPIESDFVPRVLHIEDDADFAEVLRANFANNADITNALSLTEGKAALEREEFDLVIIDWELPDGDGHDALLVIAQHQKDVPVIGLSATDSDQDDARILHNLTKSRTDIGDVVESVLNAIVKDRAAA